VGWGGVGWGGVGWGGVGWGGVGWGGVGSCSMGCYCGHRGRGGIPRRVAVGCRGVAVARRLAEPSSRGPHIIGLLLLVRHNGLLVCRGHVLLAFGLRRLLQMGICGCVCVGGGGCCCMCCPWRAHRSCLCATQGAAGVHWTTVAGSKVGLVGPAAAAVIVRGWQAGMRTGQRGLLPHLLQKNIQATDTQLFRFPHYFKLACVAEGCTVAGSSDTCGLFFFARCCGLL
jgi:hypothetical protein